MAWYKKRTWRKVQILLLPKYERQYISIFYFFKFFCGVGVAEPEEVLSIFLVRMFFLVFFVTL